MSASVYKLASILGLPRVGPFPDCSCPILDCPYPMAGLIGQIFPQADPYPKPNLAPSQADLQALDGA